MRKDGIQTRKRKPKKSGTSTENGKEIKDDGKVAYYKQYFSNV